MNTQVISVDGATTKVTYTPKLVRGLILKSSRVRALVYSKAQEIASRANGMYGASGYGAKVKDGSARVRGIVYTGDLHSIRSNHKHNTLQKALGGSK